MFIRVLISDVLLFQEHSEILRTMHDIVAFVILKINVAEEQSRKLLILRCHKIKKERHCKM